MGYCYDLSHRLCCDRCGKAGGVRKRKCPHSYCPPPALCDDCYHAVKDELKAHHERHCKPAAAAYKVREDRRKALEAEGVPVRCSAMSHAKYGVHVIFRSGKGEVGYYMNRETYDAIPLLEVATPDDYRKHGRLRKAPADFYAKTA